MPRLSAVARSVVVTAAVGLLAHSQPLPALLLLPNSTTVSGFSYGGDMAVQAHVAYSKTIVGCCGFSAQPEYCAVKKWTREPSVFKTSAYKVLACSAARGGSQGPR